MTNLEERMYKDSRGKPIPRSQRVTTTINVEEMSKEEKDNYIIKQISSIKEKQNESQKKIDISYGILLFFLICWFLSFCYFIYLRLTLPNFQF